MLYVPQLLLRSRRRAPLRTTPSPSPNLILWSEQFQQPSWTKFNVTATADQTNDPDGLLTADLLTPVSETSWIGQNSAVTPNPGGVYTVSVWAKGGPLWSGLGGIELILLENGGSRALSDFAVSADWQRFSWSGVLSSSPTSVGLRIYPDIGGHGIDVYTWGAKLEEEFTTDYVKREGT